MILYDLKTGMNTRRVRIFLAEKGISIKTVEIDMMKGENRTADFLVKNPMGTMPVLMLDDGSYLSESMAICRFFEEMMPEPPLFGSTPVERARIEMWNRRMEIEVMDPIVQAFRHLSPFWKDRQKQVAAAGELAREHAFARMQWLDAELLDRPFLSGNSYTVADITAQCAFVLGKNTGTPIGPELVNLARWFRDVTSRSTARA